MSPAANDPGVGPLATLLGIRRVAMADGRCEFALTAGPQHMNPHGVVHGGVIYTLVDFAMGGALTSVLEADERCATLELKINYLAAACAGDVRAEARVVSRTRRVAVLEAQAYGPEPRLLALATGTFYVQASAS